MTVYLEGPAAYDGRALALRVLRLAAVASILAFGLTGSVGFVLEKGGFRLKENPQPIAWALFIGGVLFLIVERWLRGRPLRDEITWSVAVAVGLGQLIAIIFPGASRSGTTILLSLMLGLNRPAATEFSH